MCCKRWWICSYGYYQFLSNCPPNWFCFHVIPLSHLHLLPRRFCLPTVCPTGAGGLGIKLPVSCPPNRCLMVRSAWAPAASAGCTGGGGGLVLVWKSSCRSSSVPEVLVTTWQLGRPPSTPQGKLKSKGAARRWRSTAPLTLPASGGSVKAGIAFLEVTLQHLLPSP